MAAEPTPAPPFGELGKSIKINELQPANAQAAITDTKYVASFNWMKGSVPSIVVPGMPPKWTPLRRPEKLEPDTGPYYRDINSAHYSQHPIEPAVRALLAQRKDLSCDEIDVFACGSTIGQLLRLALGTDKPFRFVAELIGETVFLVRRENSPAEEIQGITGYNHTFSERYTTWSRDVQQSDSHQRMVRYNFAGYDCIVRSGGDGYLPEKVENENILPATGLNLPELGTLYMREGGSVVPQDALFDLKTRSFWKKDDVLSSEISRLWARQIPNFVMAYHEYGTFKDLRVQDVREKISRWEKDHQKELRLLASIVSQIVTTLRDGPNDRLEICSQDPGILEFRHVGGTFPRALPEDLQRTWAHDTDKSESTDGKGSEEGDSDSGDDYLAA